MTGDDVMASAWQILSDEDEPHEFYPAQKMIKWINEAVNQVKQRRPTCLVASGGLPPLTVVTPITVLTGTLSIGDRWLGAVTEWVVMRAFQTDSEDKGDQGQAKIHAEMFDKLVMQ